MAEKDLNRLMLAREHMVINPNSSGSSEHVADYMENSGWTGEIFVQLKEGDASIWTLAKDNATAIEFISKNQIQNLTNLQISAVTPSSTNVKEEYALVNASGDVKGSTIKIYKDSSLYSAYLGHVDDELTSSTDPTVISGTGDAALCFIYLKTDGTYELVAINVESFLEESEFSDGLEVNNHVVSVKVDPTSEQVITGYNEGTAITEDVISVGPNGVKVANIQDAIDTAVGRINVNGFTAITDGTNTITADAPGTVVNISGSSTVGITVDEQNKKLVFESPEVAISGDTYVTATTNNHDIVISTDVVDTIDGFSGSTDISGKLVDAGVIKQVIVNNERVVAAALNDLNDKIDSVDGNIEELSAATIAEIERAKAAENSISGDVNTLSGSVVTLSGDVQTLSGEVITLSGSVVTLSGDVQTLSGHVETISGNVETLSGSVVTLSGDVQTVSGNVVTLSGSVVTLSGDVETLSGHVETVSGNVVTLSGSVVTLSGDVETLSGAVQTLSGAVQTQDIATSTSADTGLAAAYNVKTYAINDIDMTDSATTSGVVVQVDNSGVRKLDFSGLYINCGTF